MILFYLIVNLLGLRFASPIGDYSSQHIKFFDYLRTNFKETHDLVPQFNTNMGSGQSFVSLYYYGMYNPYVLLSYLVPFISTINYIGIIHIISSALSAAFMMKLLRQFNIKLIICYIVCFMLIFTPAFFIQFQVHLMFIYFFPYFILSLIAIHSLVKEDKIITFIISIALMFVFNFSFAVSIFTYQLVFFIILCVHYKLSLKQSINKLLKAALAYFIGLGLSAMVVIPQLMSTFGENRVINASPDIPFINLNSLYDVILNSQRGGVGVIALFACIYAFFNRKEDKLSFYLAIFITIVVLSGHLNSFLNAFMYLHTKVLIYLIPLIFLLFGFVLESISNLKKANNKKILLLSGFSTALVLIFIILNNGLENGQTIFIKEERDVALFLSISIFTLVTIVINTYKNNKRYIVGFTVLMCIVSLNIFSSFMTKSEFNEIIYSKYKYKYKFSESDPYLQLAPKNKVMNINHTNPVLYTSILNSYYLDFLNYYLELPRSGADRGIQVAPFENMLMQKYFGINLQYKEVEKKIVNEKKLTNTKPSIYAVEDKDVYNVSSLDKLSPYDRNFAVNAGTFSDSSQRDFLYDRLDSEVIVDSSEKVSPEEEKIQKTYKLPDDLDNEDLVTIEIYASESDLTKGMVQIIDQIGYFRKKNDYNEPKIGKNTFLMDGKKLYRKEVTINYGLSSNIYDKITIKRYKKKDLNKLNIPYLNVDSYKKITNKGYDVNINMDNEGYLVTKIPYDEAFVIKNNNKIVELEKIDGHFVGVKLNKGDNNINIRYKIKGFELGKYLSLISTFILFGIVVVNYKISENKKNKHASIDTSKD